MNKLMQDDKTTLPPSWRLVVRRYVERYGNARCERWSEELVYVDNGLPKPIYFEDPVLRGFARKAATALSYVCTDCGRQAKPRAICGGWSVQCAACWGRHSLVRQIAQLLDEAVEEAFDPFDGKAALWPEHELPLLLRACIPNACWRRTTMPSGDTMRYLSREDVFKMVPWFRRLESVMRPSGLLTSGS